MKCLSLLAFLLGAMSIVYELALTHLIAGLYGNTFVRYAVVLGLFLLSSGLASLCANKLKIEKAQRMLGILENVLGAVLALSFVFVVWIYSKSTFAAYVWIHFCIIFVGVCTGLELPFALSIHSSERSIPWLVQADYIGAGMGGIVFGSVLFPVLGINGIFGLMTTLNAIVAAILLRKEKLWLYISLGNLALCALLYYKIDSITDYVLNNNAN